ncbi:hypothetical protein EVAR_32024_1 [Eumeta japonica]|uniref:Uncharacterized protein n=1 Tax=Eumeta variegata TaxID=151549 RepID=A0A4C1YNB0_EUMVA|nr:hypothetical protein EVAR_32024_1 [Eumeta japonica]
MLRDWDLYRDRCQRMVRVTLAVEWISNGPGSSILSINLPAGGGGAGSRRPASPELTRYSPALTAPAE